MDFNSYTYCCNIDISLSHLSHVWDWWVHHSCIPIKEWEGFITL